MKKHSDIQREKELRAIKQIVEEQARLFRLEMLKQQREDDMITKKLIS